MPKDPVSPARVLFASQPPTRRHRTANSLSRTGSRKVLLGLLLQSQLVPGSLRVLVSVSSLGKAQTHIILQGFLLGFFVHCGEMW